MASFTLSELRTLVTQRADLALNDQFITTAEVNGLINRAISKLWDLALENPGQMFIPPQDFSFTAPTTAPNVYSLAGAYKVTGVELWADAQGSMRVPLQPAMPDEVPGLMSTSNIASTLFGGRYRVSGGLGLTSTSGLVLMLYPPAQANQTVVVHYVPPAPILVNDSTPVTFPNGWEDYVVIDAAIKCIAKEEGDTRELQRQRDELGEAIKSASSSLDRGEPERVQDVVTSGYGYDGWGGWGGGW